MSCFQLAELIYHQGKANFCQIGWGWKSESEETQLSIKIQIGQEIHKLINILLMTNGDELIQLVKLIYLRQTFVKSYGDGKLEVERHKYQ